MKCQYCNKKKSFKEEANKLLISKDFENDVSVILEIDRGRLALSTENVLIYKNTNWEQIDGAWCLTSKKINYCPMCGRKLDENE